MNLMISKWFTQITYYCIIDIFYYFITITILTLPNNINFQIFKELIQYFLTNLITNEIIINVSFYFLYCHFKSFI